MKAVICSKYGPPEVLQLKEVDKPVPKQDEVLIRIHASIVTASDIFIRGSRLPLLFWIPMRLVMGFTRPRKTIPGLVLAGEIISAGTKIQRFKQGDQVFGLTGFTLGAHAEYNCMKETDSMHGCLALKPRNLSYEESAVLAYGGLLAMQFMEKAAIRPGSKVLIYGASGNTGTIAIQLARHMGAEVTAVTSTSNLELVSMLGATSVIDYTRVDRLSQEVKYDFILDAVGKMKTSKLKVNCKKALTPHGRYVSIDDEKLALDSKRLDAISSLAAAGSLKPVIDTCFSLEEIVQAHKYVERGHKIGGVVIKI